MILSPKMIFVLLFILFIAGCGLNNESLGPTEEQKEEIGDHSIRGGSPEARHPIPHDWPCERSPLALQAHRGVTWRRGRDELHHNSEGGPDSHGQPLARRI